MQYFDLKSEKPTKYLFNLEKRNVNRKVITEIGVTAEYPTISSVLGEKAVRVTQSIQE